MSLFASVLPAAVTTASRLFDSHSRFKANGSAAEPPPAAAAAAPVDSLPVSRKRKAAKEARTERVHDDAAQAQPEIKRRRHGSRQAALSADPVDIAGTEQAARQDKPRKKRAKQRGAQPAYAGAAGAADPGTPSVDAADDADGCDTDVDAVRAQPPAATAADTAAAAVAAARKQTPEEEAEKLQRTIFVGNLPPELTPKQLRRLFKQYGAVESVRLRSVPVQLDVKMPRRAAIITGKVSSDRGGANGFVVFQEAGAVQAALAANMAEVEGHHIRVDRAAAPSSKRGGEGGGGGAGEGGGGGAGGGGPAAFPPERSVFVGNLDFKVGEEELIRVFGGAGAVEAVRVVRDKATNVGKGIAFVLLTTKEAVRGALQLNGKQLGAGRAMRVTRVSRGGGGGGGHQGRRASRVGGGGGAAARAGGGRSSPSFQGTRTKGRHKKATKPVKTVVKASQGGAAKGRAAGKRPAVAARKAAAKGARKRAAAAK